MITINGKLVRSVALAATAVVGVMLYHASATAQNGKENGKKNGEENGKENGKKNGEEDEKDEEGWKVIGKLNPALLIWNDGRNGAPSGTGRRRGAYVVDNDQDNSGIALEGKFKLDHGWTAGLKFSLDTKVVHSDSVSQLEPGGRTDFEVGDAHLELGHEKFGKIVLGHGDSASDGTSNVNLAGSNVLADAEVENWNGSFFLRAAGTGLTPLRWGDFFGGPQVGDTGRFITYWTPKVMGLEVGVAVGQPQEIFLYRSGRRPLFEEKTGGVLTDIGIKYEGKWADTFLVKAQFGAFKDTTEDRDAVEPTEDVGFGGSFAVRHIATGLNIAVNAGTKKYTNRCAEPGEVTGRCRGDDRFLYVKGGIVRDFFAWGPTALYGEHYRGRRAQNESDETVLRALELNLDEAEELKRSLQTVWGLGVVQTIKPDSTRNFTTDLYVGYRNFALEVDLIGAEGSGVPARKVNNFSAVMAGIRLRYGESDKD